MNNVKKILITVATGIVSFMFLCIWVIIFWITGILMLIDWIYYTWNGHRIGWITSIMDCWSEMFNHPFTRH